MIDEIVRLVIFANSIASISHVTPFSSHIRLNHCSIDFWADLQREAFCVISLEYSSTSFFGNIVKKWMVLSFGLTKCFNTKFTETFECWYEERSRGTKILMMTTLFDLTIRFVYFRVFFSFRKKKSRYKTSLWIINKTRFYTHARIKHTHEIVLSARSTTDIVFGTSSSSVFSSRLFFAFDVVEEKKKPQECGKEW